MARRPWRCSVLFLLLSALFGSAHAFAWDDATHCLITRLAIEALPASPLRSLMRTNQSALERYSDEPDSVLKARYGEAEARRHYIDLEDYGADPLSKLVPDAREMQRRFGRRRFYRAGTLPWTIEDFSARVASDWRTGDCASLLRDSGYLAHYVGDATQPLHATRHYDGYAQDRGMHARIELAVDHDTREIGARAESLVRVADITSPWEVALGEIRDASRLVDETMRDDREARAQGYGASYNRALMRYDGDLFVHQIAAAASALGSIWLYEWRGAGSPAGCEQ